MSETNEQLVQRLKIDLSDYLEKRRATVAVYELREDVPLLMYDHVYDEEDAAARDLMNTLREIIRDEIAAQQQFTRDCNYDPDK